MTHICKGCMRENGLKDLFRRILYCSGKKFFQYKQQVTVDRYKFIEKSKNTKEFVTSLTNRIVRITKHNYVLRK